MILQSNLVCGYTCQDHLLVDLDDCNFRKAKRLTLMIMREYPDLGDVLIVRSSDAHYHLIFGSIVSWERLIQVIETLAVLGIVQKAYAQVRTFRRDLTLRISGKNGEDKIRPVPEPVRFITRWNNEKERAGIERYMWTLKAFRDCPYPESERL